MEIDSAQWAIAVIVSAMALTPLRSPEQLAQDAESMTRASALIRQQVMPCLIRPAQRPTAAVTMRFHLQVDGTLRASPQLLEATPTPAQRALAAAAAKAIRSCAPFDIPAEFHGSPYLWTTQTMVFE